MRGAQRRFKHLELKTREPTQPVDNPRRGNRMAAEKAWSERSGQARGERRTMVEKKKTIWWKES